MLVGLVAGLLVVLMVLLMVGSWRVRIGQAYPLRRTGQAQSLPRRVARRAGAEAVVDLRYRRAWFAEGDDDNDVEIDLSSLDPTVRAYIEKREQRIKELNNESAGRRHEISDLKTRIEAMESAQREQLEQQGQYKSR